MNTGIIPILLEAKTEGQDFEALEIQPVHTDQYSICGNDYNSDGKCFSGSDGLDMPY